MENAEALEYPHSELYFQTKIEACFRSYRRASVAAERTLLQARADLSGFLSSLGVTERHVAVPFDLVSETDECVKDWLFCRKFSTGHLKLRSVSKIGSLRTWLGPVIMAQHPACTVREGFLAILTVRDEWMRR
jgi:hypothetical protein